MIRTRRGVTLIELLVVIVILALMASTVATTLHVAKRDTLDDRDRVIAAKREAIQRGKQVRILLNGSSRARLVTALPDGRVIGFHGVPLDSTDQARDDTTH